MLEVGGRGPDASATTAAIGVRGLKARATGTSGGARATITSMPVLRPYQQEAGRAVLASVRGRLGRTISIEIARQGGKNELSA